MMTRREVVRLLGSVSTAAWLAAAQPVLFETNVFAAGRDDATPALAPGIPKSPERMALIEAFLKESEGLQNKFEGRTLKHDWVMPY